MRDLGGGLCAGAGGEGDCPGSPELLDKVQVASTALGNGSPAAPTLNPGGGPEREALWFRGASGRARWAGPSCSGPVLGKPSRGTNVRAFDPGIPGEPGIQGV